MTDSLDNVFQGIYKSIVEAQNTIEQHYVGEVKEDYFDKKGNPYMMSAISELHSALLKKAPELLSKGAYWFKDNWRFAGKRKL